MAEEAIWVVSCSSRVQLWTIMRRFITCSGSIYFSRETKEKQCRSTHQPLPLIAIACLCISVSVTGRKRETRCLPYHVKINISLIGAAGRLARTENDAAWKGIKSRYSGVLWRGRAPQRVRLQLMWFGCGSITATTIWKMKSLRFLQLLHHDDYILYIHCHISKNT